MTSIEDRKLNLLKTAESLGTPKFAVPEVSMADVIRRLDAKDPSLVLLDTRSEEERSVSTIPGSISKADFEADLETYKSKEVVTFCTVGYLAGAYACELTTCKGFDKSKVFNLGDGSLLGWTLEGKPLVKPDGSSSTTVHTFLGALGGLAGDGLSTTNFEEADAGARLEAANKHIAATLGL